MAEKRTFKELLEAYRKTAVEQSKQTGTSMNDCGAMLCGGDILDDLADEIYKTVYAEGVEHECFRIWHYKDIHPASPNIRAVLIPVMAFEPAMPVSILAPDVTPLREGPSYYAVGDNGDGGESHS